MDRRDFILQNLALPAVLSATDSGWNPGPLLHLLPTVSHSRILLKASFSEPMKSPRLRVGKQFVEGWPTDTGRRFWTFDASGLQPGANHELQLFDARRAITSAWNLKTFPDPSERVSHLRLMVYTCAGGHPVLKLTDGESRFLSLERRRRMLARGLSYRPDAVIANGDHVYWDLRTSGSPTQGASPEGTAFAGTFRRNLPVFGTENERVLQRAAGPQIAELYGADFRETPVFFITDDHDHFDNDEADDRLVSFPPDAFMLRLARATRRLYYPEFLPDANRPPGLADAAAADTPSGTAEAFGTLRYGRLAEVLLYDCRRFLTLAGPSATCIPAETEDWITSRLADPSLDHIIQVPSLPIGWSAGKWGDWYPDILDAKGRLGVSQPKPYWQQGWAAQHDRLLKAASDVRGRVPIFLCGDLHAIGEGRIHKTASVDLSRNPVVSILTGPVSTGRTGWPSSARGTPPLPPQRLEIEERIKAFEENGFSIVDLSPEKITVRLFRWTVNEPDAALDRLEPFHTVQLPRPS